MPVGGHDNPTIYWRYIMTTLYYLFATGSEHLMSGKIGQIEKGSCISRHTSYPAANRKCDSLNKKARSNNLIVIIESTDSYQVGEVYLDMINEYLADQEELVFARLLNDVIEHEQGDKELPEYKKELIGESGLSMDKFRKRYGKRAQSLREMCEREDQERAERQARINAVDNGLRSHADICYSFPAVLGIQAGQAFYLAMIPVNHLLKIFTFDEEDVVPPEMRAQRQLNPVRAKKIGQYILGNLGNFILPALTATVSEEMTFEPLPVEGSGSSLGVLNLPMDSLFNIVDGQHRRAGYEYAVKHATNLQKIELKKETVSVVLKFDQGLKCSQQYFSDINCSAVKPSSSISALYNHRDQFNVFIQELLQSMPDIRALVDMENASVGAKSVKLWSLVGFSKFVSLLTSLNSRNFDNLVNDKNRQNWKTIITRFVNELKHIPSWEALIKRPISGYEARQELIISHTVFLEALGIMGNHLMQGKSFAQVEWNQMAGLSDIDINKSSACWENRCVVLGKMQKTTDGAKATAALLCQAVGIELSPALRDVEAKLST